MAKQVRLHWGPLASELGCWECWDVVSGANTAFRKSPCDPMTAAWGSLFTLRPATSNA